MIRFVALVKKTVTYRNCITRKVYECVEKDTRESLPVDAFDAQSAIAKLKRRGELALGLLVSLVPLWVWPKRRWDESKNRGQGGFVHANLSHPSYADTIPNPNCPQHPRMKCVHDRLTADLNRSIYFSQGWKAATAAFSPRKKLETALKAAVKSAKPGEYAARYERGFRCQWARLASKPVVKTTRRRKTPAATELFAGFQPA